MVFIGFHWLQYKCYRPVQASEEWNLHLKQILINWTWAEKDYQDFGTGVMNCKYTCGTASMRIVCVCITSVSINDFTAIQKLPHDCTRVPYFISIPNLQRLTFRLVKLFTESTVIPVKFRKRIARLDWKIANGVCKFP